jgi:maleate cis-trans isomerase
LLTTQTLPAYRAQALELANRFPEVEIDIVAYGCTAAGFISGPAGDAQLAADLAAVTGKPVVTTAQSMVQVLGAGAANDVALVTPYVDHVNEQLTAFLAEGGIRVRSLASLRAADVQALGRNRSDEVAALARATMSEDCGGLFIACSQLPTFDILDALVAEYAPRPVSSSICATAQAACRVYAQQVAAGTRAAV